MLKETKKTYACGLSVGDRRIIHLRSSTTKQTKESYKCGPASRSNSEHHANACYYVQYLWNAASVNARLLLNVEAVQDL